MCGAILFFDFERTTQWSERGTEPLFRPATSLGTHLPFTAKNYKFNLNFFENIDNFINQQNKQENKFNTAGEDVALLEYHRKN